jgi:hypothetical protein
MIDNCQFLNNPAAEAAGTLMLQSSRSLHTLTQKSGQPFRERRANV